MRTQLNKYALVLGLLSSTTAFAFSHTELMWGLKNTGKTISTSVNPLQGYKLQAVAGEDINLAPQVKGRKVKVAVLDTGFDFEHTDLKFLISRNAEKCEALEKLKQCLEKAKDANDANCRTENLQAAENVYPADCKGWSVLNQSIQNTPNNIIGRPDFEDADGHGTHVSGIIAQVTSNIEIIPVQIIGVGPNAPMKPFSIDLSPNENIRKGYETDYLLSERVARAIIYAMNRGAEVINLSMGWPENANTDIIREAIAEAQKRGIIIVAAAGNDSTNALLRPCQYKGVICVAAQSPDGSLSSFTNYGYGVDIAAPGVEIVSTIPENIRSIGMPGYKGYDYKSGTSQATPFVTGVVAEMLSRGIPSKEIYPRLMLGARKVKKELPMLVGPVNGSNPQVVDASTTYTKTVLSGLLDMTRSLQVTEQSLILPAHKDVQYINWDRKSTDLKFNIDLKNYWKAIKGQKVQVVVKSSVSSALEPEVVAVKAQQDLSNWAQGEEKTLEVQLKIKDQSDASLSRLPSELSYQVSVIVDGKLHRKFEVQAAVMVIITQAITGGDVYGYDIVGQIPRETKLTLVDEILDSKQTLRDYFVIGKDEKDEKAFNIGLMRASQKGYQVEAVQKMKFDGDLSLTRPQYKMRLDLDGDGNSEYIYGIIEYLDKEATIYGDYRNHFYIFDNNMQLKQYVIFDDKRAALPYQFYWMKVKGQMRPAWVGKGQEITKQIDVTDLWSVEDKDTVVKNFKTKSDIHFYYLDENFKLQQLESEVKEERIVDIIQTSLTQSQRGVVTILLAKNMGTETKPSYINEFSVATVVDGKIQSNVKMDTFSGGMGYRNLVDTFADKVSSLASEASEFRGMMWYGLESHQRQRVTLIDVEQKQIFDKMIQSQRSVQDSALLVKAGFQSKERKGVFLITNSELEYHDLTSDQVVARSLNRYSFIGDQNFVELQFPITLVDRMNAGQKLPALFTTEQSGLSRGIRMLVPVYGKDGKLQQMVTPARLRLKSEKGCKPLESPVYLGENSGYAMDYHCGAKILRFLLKY